MEGNLGFWEGNFAEKKDKNEKFCFAKVEALTAQLSKLRLDGKHGVGVPESEPRSRSPGV